jgi:ribonuclease-3
VNETAELIDNNEKLEFLGDSVLGMVVADYLFRLLPDRPEGDLAKIKSHVVSEKSLAGIALKLGIDTIVHVGNGEEISGGRNKKALLSDTMEALIGAWYLDAGYEKASRFILGCLKDLIDMVLADRHVKDYKTLLQEMAQKRFHMYPRYVLDSKTGPDHQKTFWMNVHVAGEIFGPGRGDNKKAAEQEAARIAFESLS